MKVIHILGGRPDPDSLNGVEIATYYMASAQARLGLSVGVFAMADSPPSPADGVEGRAFRRRPWRFHAPAGLIAALEAAGPDVVHLHSPYFPEHVPISRWARKAGVPYVVTPHGALSPGELALRWAVKLPYKYLFERSILNGAAFVHALSAHEQLERYGVRSPIVFVPNGVDLCQSSRIRHRPLSDLHPALAGCTVFLFLGRLEPMQKGLDLLIAAAARTGRDIALVLAGPDYRGGRRQVAKLIAASGCRGPIILRDPFVGLDKIEALAEADVFVHTSRWEGMPQAVLEAAAQGRPLLVTPVADPADRLCAMNAAVLVQPAVEAIADGLNRLRDMTADERGDMGERARRVATEFTWQRTALALKDAYERYALK